VRVETDSCTVLRFGPVRLHKIQTAGSSEKLPRFGVKVAFFDAFFLKLVHQRLRYIPP